MIKDLETRIRKVTNMQDSAKSRLLKTFKGLTDFCEREKLEIETDWFAVKHVETISMGKKEKKYTFCFENPQGKVVSLNSGTSFDDVHYLSFKVKDVFDVLTELISVNDVKTSEVESNMAAFNQAKQRRSLTVTPLKPFLIKATSKITSFLAKISCNADQKIREFEKPVIISKCQPSAISTESNVPENLEELSEELSEELIEV